MKLEGTSGGTMTTTTRCDSCEREDRVAMVECVECEVRMCADCLIEHQMDIAKTAHRLMSLRTSVYEDPREINNNQIDEKPNNNNKNNHMDILNDAAAAVVAFKRHSDPEDERNESVSKRKSMVIAEEGADEENEEGGDDCAVSSTTNEFTAGEDTNASTTAGYNYKKALFCSDVRSFIGKNMNPTMAGRRNAEIISLLFC